ncbi:bacillithiol system redox-active protein YtxJ [Aureibaculum sp. 2210JD6-5]|uniref:bacillithiol system redox-active protein YtxJ n=1 Tax=Aureibaculum sp. 2210JD6-5 TaxID=3103957 RepID=UPI002AAC5BB2|nr:bacillithiol system redox-active protein YtxJ [Aureibaculum sp. 2210JD6-5]MDY7395076.1 bacillithiol system redox-active protein YtxJ [Aureibaculum sp. 2210JD6-5]
MGILKSLFGKSSTKTEQPKINWIPLTENKQLDEIVEKSKSKTQVIFKHSTRCGISSGVIRQFEKKEIDDSVDLYYLDLLNFRNISNEVASIFNVVHQSPQLLIIKNGKAVKYASHYDLLSLEIIENS